MEPLGVVGVEANTNNKGWLQNHLESFVQPVLGYVPTLSKDYSRFFSPSEMAVIKNMWRSAKAESKRLGKPLLLAGRDVFVWEILARREGFPTVFRPDISRLTVSHVTEDYTQHFLFDTGFMGSIPRALGSKHYQMGSSIHGGSARSIFGGHRLITTETNQIFPRLKGARSLILKMERTPKYWRRAFWRTNPLVYNWIVKSSYPGQIGQEQTEQTEFLAAALLTIEIYKDSSPALVAGPIDISSHSRGYLYGMSGTD